MLRSDRKDDNEVESTGKHGAVLSLLDARDLTSFADDARNIKVPHAFRALFEQQYMKSEIFTPSEVTSIPDH